MKKTIIIVVACLASLFLFPQMVLAAPPTEGNWVLLPGNSDEFNGEELDKTKWKNGIWYDSSSELAFHPDNVVVANGQLQLVAKNEEYLGKNYTAGAVESRFEIPGTASYVEVRAKVLNRRANVLSAIWLQSSPLSWSLNPNPEIDILETFDYSKMTSTLHTWWQKPAFHIQHASRGWRTGLEDISQDYHIYGLERRNGVLKFYFDGHLTWEKRSWTQSFHELSRHMVLSLEGHLGHPIVEQLPTSFAIDYVRTYYDGDVVSPIPAGNYMIINRHSGKALTYMEGNQELLVQKPIEDAVSWWLHRHEEGTYSFYDSQTDKCIDLTASGGVTENATPIIYYDYHGGANQKWYLVPTEDGAFKIISYLSGKSLCVKNASKLDGAPIVQWTYEDNQDTNDEWFLVAKEE